MVSFVVSCLPSDSFIMSALPNLSHRVSLVYIVLAYQVCSVETVLCYYKSLLSCLGLIVCPVRTFLVCLSVLFH